MGADRSMPGMSRKTVLGNRSDGKSFKKNTKPSNDVARINEMYFPDSAGKRDNNVRKVCGPSARTTRTYDVTPATDVPLADPTAPEMADATGDPQSAGDASKTKPDKPQQTLQHSQYARKDAKDGGDAGKYYVEVGVTAPNKQYPGGVNEGSTSGPLVASADYVSFNTKDPPDGQMHKITIYTPPLNDGRDPKDQDNSSLTVEGFPKDGDKFDTSNPGNVKCDVGKWQPTGNNYAQQKIPTLGDTRRDILCLADSP